MIYLSGTVRSALYGIANFGFICTPAMGNVLPHSQLWAADTGCFAKPAAFSITNYQRWLATRDLSSCLFATVPDRVADWNTTLSVWREHSSTLTDCGTRLAIVLQDGATEQTVPWDECAAVFIGGSTAWKLSPQARALAVAGRARKKWVHMGRVNSLRRLRIAQMWGCDSVDGTFLKFGPDVNLPKLHRWIKWLNSQHLFSSAAA